MNEIKTTIKSIMDTYDGNIIYVLDGTKIGYDLSALNNAEAEDGFPSINIYLKNKKKGLPIIFSSNELYNIHIEILFNLDNYIIFDKKFFTGQLISGIGLLKDLYKVGFWNTFICVSNKAGSSDDKVFLKAGSKEWYEKK